MTTMQRRFTIPLLAAAALACVVGGCTSSSPREEYFESRAAIVAAQPGTGVGRMAMWPANVWGRRTVALADRRTASDAPVAPADSTR